jgi:two-component system OmpR family response regulator
MDKNHPKKLLIVDDEIHIVKALDFIFSSEGFLVETAHDGSSALSAADRFRPDIILLDVMMPDIDGFSVAQSIRRNEQLHHTSIIFLTAKGAAEDKMSGYDSGGEYYVVKPFDNDDIVQKVREALDIKS